MTFLNPLDVLIPKNCIFIFCRILGRGMGGVQTQILTPPPTPLLVDLVRTTFGPNLAPRRRKCYFFLVHGGG